MKKIVLPFLLPSIIATGIFFSCKKETSCEGCKENKPPIAIAGPDQVITLPTDSILLDGSASNDPDGTISEWLWKKISGPASFMVNSSSTSKSVVKNLGAGVYQFELKVTDNAGLSAKDTMQVIVNDPSQPNRPPVANAGTDQMITLPTNNAPVNGTGSTDPDNNIITYLWTKILGPTSFNIINTNAAQTQVTNLIQGTYQFELKVTDAGGLFSKDTTQVVVNAQGPPSVLPGNCGNFSRPQVNAQLIPIGTLSQAGDRIVAASAGSKIVFAGRTCCPGSNMVDIYDTVTHTWSIATLSVPRWGIAAIAAGNKIFFAGGEFGDGAFDTYYSTVDIYDASTNSWSVASLSQPRSQIAAATVGNKIFFAGGEKDMSYNSSDVVDIHDIGTNSWSTTYLSQPRSLITAVTVGDKIYFAGGAYQFQWNNSISDRIDIYDNSTSTWSVSNLTEPKAAFAGIAVDSKIYWAGGFNGTSNWGSSCQVEIKNATTGSSSISYLSRPGIWFIDHGSNAVLKGNKIIFFRQEWNNPADNEFDMYDIVTNTWSIGLLPISFHPSSIISVNNTIYVVGGNQVWKLEF